MAKPFSGVADQATTPPRHFRDEDGIEWAGPHGPREACPWGSCPEIDYRPWVDPNGVMNGMLEGRRSTEADREQTSPWGSGGERPFCHNVDEETAYWDYFIKNQVYIKELR